ncbi:MAG: hypothetical protein E7634_06250 [Ruminococcaceae bacterium]|nr:hypothetical protein [Oscillospiraceae bacterium]
MLMALPRMMLPLTGRYPLRLRPPLPPPFHPPAPPPAPLPFAAAGFLVFFSGGGSSLPLTSLYVRVRSTSRMSGTVRLIRVRMVSAVSALTIKLSLSAMFSTRLSQSTAALMTSTSRSSGLKSGAFEKSMDSVRIFCISVSAVPL